MSPQSTSPSTVLAYCADKTGLIRQARRLSGKHGPLRQYLGISAFAEHMLLDENALIAAPAGLTADTAVLLSCGITTGIAAIVNNERPPAGGTVAVIGCGAVGLGAVIGARLSGASAIFASDLLAHRLQAAAALGATLVINAADTDPCEEILQANRGGVARAVEAVGLPVTAIQALRVLRRGGHATVLGMMPNGAQIPLPARLLQEGRSIGGAVMGRARVHADIPRYARLAADGRVDLSGLVSTRRPLGEINAAFADAGARRGVRHLIEF
jgi:S-(hydroxymethyl)glutathione dehydrogenase/alcohol dehydrogenase